MRFGVPPVGPELRDWAHDLRRWLARSWDALTYRDANATASQDGLMLWDAAGYPVVSKGGAFHALAVLVDVPASATAAGAKGQYAVDADYLYVCVATNTWRRVAVATW